MTVIAYEEWITGAINPASTREVGNSNARIRNINHGLTIWRRVAPQDTVAEDRAAVALQVHPAAEDGSGVAAKGDVGQGRTTVVQIHTPAGVGGVAAEGDVGEDRGRGWNGDGFGFGGGVGLLSIKAIPPPLTAKLAVKVTLVKVGLLLIRPIPPPPKEAELALKVTLVKAGLLSNRPIPPPPDAVFALKVTLVRIGLLPLSRYIPPPR